MIALLYLKHAFNLSDEALVERWSETPRWQYFSGQAYYEERLPCDATTLVKFRRLLGEEGVEELLAQTIKLAVDLQLIPTQALASVVVDTTVQEKAVAHPTDSKLLESIKHRGKAKSLTAQERQLLKRRQAIEPIIGHLEADHRLDRCHLKGELGDSLHAVLCAAGYNLRWLLCMMAKKGVAFLWGLFLSLCQAAQLQQNGPQMLRVALVGAPRRPLSGAVSA